MPTTLYPVVGGRPATLPTGSCSAADAAAVATVSVALPLLVPLSVTDVGETVQVEIWGAPVQENETVCANPGVGVTVTE
jgi:hypothetical protein